MRINYFKAALFILVLTVGCQQKQSESTTALGTIDFDVTSSEEAIAHFEQGVLLLHSFMYSDAAKEFRKAQELDSNFAMAYWGEAMTHNHPLWSQQNYEKATAILSRLGETKEDRLVKAPTDFEHDLYMAVEILFGEGTKIERDDKYADYLAELRNKYPDNHEIAAFYALSLLGSVEEGRDYEVYGRGAKVAKSILKENPNHPGALHYLIHAYDDPDHASLALAAANSYSEVAPDAGHALHMPSHIYIAMGMWDEVITSNIRSFDARKKRVDQGTSSGWNLHAYHWLLYGYLQKSNKQEAKKIMSSMEAYVERPNLYSYYYPIEMLGIYLAETGEWDAFPNFLLSSEGLNIQSIASHHFIQGKKAAERGSIEKLESIIENLEKEIDQANNEFVMKGIAVCSGVGFASRPPGQDDINMAKVVLLQLRIELAQLQGLDDSSMERMLMQATDLESKISFVFGPPSIVIPTYEMYGDWLVSKGRFNEALVQYDTSLKKGPGRRKALIGKLEAAKGMNDKELVRELEDEIEKMSMQISTI